MSCLTFYDNFGKCRPIFGICFYAVYEKQLHQREQKTITLLTNNCRSQCHWQAGRNLNHVLKMSVIGTNARSHKNYCRLFGCDVISHRPTLNSSSEMLTGLWLFLTQRASPEFLKYWNWILCTHNLALIKVKSDRMLPNFTLVIATVQWLFMTNVTWQQFDQSAK